jgi:hypothetical protein
MVETPESEPPFALVLEPTPAGARRVGGLPLTLPRQFGNGTLGVGQHQTMSSPAAPPVADHSFTRAR